MQYIQTENQHQAVPAGQAGWQLARERALLRMDLTPSRIVLVDEDRAVVDAPLRLTLSRIVLEDEDRVVVDAALTRAAMERCSVQLEMALELGGDATPAAVIAIARHTFLRFCHPRAASDSGGGSSGSAGTITWRHTACVACLEPQGAAPWHYCHMCGVHIHVKCAAEVAHRQKRGDDGGAGSGGSRGGGGGGCGGGGGIGGGGSAVACDYRAARDSGGDSSGSSGGAATIRRRGAACVACVDPQGAVALMPHILRAPTRIDPQANTLALTPVYPAHPIADHVHLHVRQPSRLSRMLHTADMAAATSGALSVAARRAGRLERVLVPLLNEVDDEPFCSDHFT
ncbi:hypothetical protein JKP88DRAFT_335427 [Tribonema minus]|uniref:Uncharacterized protein n=1 Tax=Tribonema minus TaxID=303371 RepID=A0A836C837_9STRA|nr:hypothetical protein JKP88DRAFT_335427 [Tribonema minus]